MKDLHVKLNDDVLERLDGLSRRLSLSRNLMIREAVSEYLTRKEREQVADEMRRYAEEMAEFSGEFVAETEPEVDRMLMEHTEW